MKKARMMVLLLGLVVLFWAAPAAAQQATVLKGAGIWTGVGPATTGVVAFGADGRLTAVGKGQGAGEVIDVTGKIITPGFIDIHTGLGLVDVDLERDTVDADPGGDMIRSAFMVADGFNPNSLVVPIQRPGGVTSVAIVPSGGLISGQSAWVDLYDPRFNAAVSKNSVAMHMAFGQHAASVTGGSRGGAMVVYRELFDDVRFYAKNTRGYDKNQSRKLGASRLDLEALVGVVEGKLPVVCGAQRASDILMVLALARQQGFKPIIVGGAEAWMVAKELAEAKVPVILDSMANLPANFEALGSREDNAVLLHAAGVPVILSTFSNHNVRNLRQMAGNAVRAGLPFEAALASITSAPAQALGMGDDYGSLEVGKRADLVVWSGDPLEFSSRVERMFIGGVEVSMDNRQRRLMERYRQLPRRAKPAPPGESP